MARRPPVLLAVTLSVPLFAGCTPHTQSAPASQRLFVANDFERDRGAILGMAGEFDVTFEFEETRALRPGYALQPKTRSHGTELVEVIEDSGRRIVLQHILVLGENHEVVKHWRQDWTYEDPEIWEYRGKDLWERQRLRAEDVRGRWSQAVYEVDDGPRYESIGGWEHAARASTWTSGRTWRPLPRREYTKRSDYHAIVAVNRHVVTPDGWTHEQDNTKLDLDAAVEAELAREMGRNTYRRIDDYDFAAGRAYWQRTAAFWADVRRQWNARMAATDRLIVHSEVAGRRLYDHMLPLADSAVAGSPTERERAIRETMEPFVESARVARATPIQSRKLLN